MNRELVKRGYRADPRDVPFVPPTVPAGLRFVRHVTALSSRSGRPYAQRIEEIVYQLPSGTFLGWIRRAR